MRVLVGFLLLASASFASPVDPPRFEVRILHESTALENERSIALPLERRFLEVESLRSCEVTVTDEEVRLELEMDAQCDVDSFRQGLLEALRLGSQELPADAATPRFEERGGDEVSAVFLHALEGPFENALQQVPLARSQAERVSRLAGVQAVEIVGAMESRVEWSLDRERLEALGLTRDEVVEKCLEALSDGPLESGTMRRLVIAARGPQVVKLLDVGTSEWSLAAEPESVLHGGRPHVAVFVRARAAQRNLAVAPEDSTSWRLVSLAHDSLEVFLPNEERFWEWIELTAGSRDWKDVVARVTRLPGEHRATLYFPEGTSFDSILARARELVALGPGVGVRWRGAGSRALDLSVLGDELDALDSRAAELGGRLRQREDVLWVDVEPAPPEPQARLVFDREACAARGVTVETVRECVQRHLTTQPLGFVKDGEREVPVFMRPSLSRDEPESWLRIRVRTPGGDSLPLADVAEVVLTAEPTSWTRKDGRRSRIVRCIPRDGRRGALLEELEKNDWLEPRPDGTAVIVR